jgi:hypothetical protein
MKRWPACALVALAAAFAPGEAFGQGATIVDSVVVRFYAPETGGAERPRFITARVLAFEARVEALSEQVATEGASLSERSVRAAVEHHIAREMLASLPLDVKPSDADVDTVKAQLLLALLDRIGGQGTFDRLAAQDGLSAGEVDVLMRREALAAIYLDRAVAPMLNPTDDQLRTVFRTSAHPYRTAKTYESVKDALARWFVSERVKAAEQSFLQTARTRVKSFAIHD